MDGYDEKETNIYYFIKYTADTNFISLLFNFYATQNRLYRPNKQS